jgi:hypothetical protein
MARIVCGFGTSHGPLLFTPPERWDLRAEDDRKNPHHPFRGREYTFPELVAVRDGERDFHKEMSLEMRCERDKRNHAALDVLASKIADIDPDIIVVVGDDQHEWFLEDNQPSFSIYAGEQVINAALDQEKMKTKSPGIALAMKGYFPTEDHVYPVPADLAHEIIRQAISDEFDVSVSSTQPKGPRGTIGIGHAFAFVQRRILKDKRVPIVPILLNTYFPPNQPTPNRCYEFGRSIGRAIAGWNGANADKRVAVCASGGISHFVVDEDFDMRVLTAIKNRDTKTIFAEPDALFRAGTSETKNWITVAGVLSETELQMNLVDYVPAYRSEAGTGCGMAFATWE